MLTGVYTITNVVNGKVYVGSAAQSLPKRWSVHKSLLRAGKHHSAPLQNAWNKYGATAFVFEPIDGCEREYCVALEQFWMNTLRSWDRRFGYNARPTAESMLGFKHDESTVAEIKERNRKWVPSKETRERMRLGQLGRKHTAETKAKISAGHKGKKVIWTEAAKKKLSSTLRKRTTFPKQTRTDRKPCTATNIHTGEVLHFESAWATGVAGFTHSSVTRALRRVHSNKNGIHKGYRWDYVSEQKTQDAGAETPRP